MRINYSSDEKNVTHKSERKKKDRPYPIEEFTPELNGIITYLPAERLILKPATEVPKEGNGAGEDRDGER